jgi:hypothetical protein
MAEEIMHYLEHYLKLEETAKKELNMKEGEPLVRRTNETYKL